MSRITKNFHAIGVWIADFLFPPLCLVCDEPVDRAQTLCAVCWKKTDFIAEPFCARCGASFDLPVESGTLCGTCLETPPVYERARSAVLYNDATKAMILRFKHGDGTSLSLAFGQWMTRCAPDIWAEADLLVPVPLHRFRLLRRRYNQSALLAQAIAKETGKKVAIDALCRIRRTEAQGHKNKKERRENVAQAFAVKNSSEIAGKRIVVIDDVLTSGATVEACAEALLQAGAAAVSVVTLSRTRIAT